MGRRCGLNSELPRKTKKSKMKKREEMRKIGAGGHGSYGTVSEKKTEMVDHQADEDSMVVDQNSKEEK